MPEAITAFLEGTDFEDVIRTAVSLGGDCDTLTCIAGSIAEAFYGVPAILKVECRRRLPEDMAYILGRFDISRKHGHDDFPGDTLSGSGIIDEAIDRCYQTGSKENRIGVSDGCSEMPGGIIIDPRGQPLPVDKRPDQYDFER